MKIKAIIDEDITNYKKMSMFIGTCKCDFKCCTEIGEDICMCQNSEIAQQKTHQLANSKIIKRYLNNSLTSAIVFGGLEPFLQFDELYDFIKEFREVCNDDIVIAKHIFFSGDFLFPAKHIFMMHAIISVYLLENPCL